MELVDLDNDGWKDLFIANGHVYSQIANRTLHLTYREPKILYRNLGNGRFEDVSAKSGVAITAVMDNTVVSASYVGTAGRNLDQSYQFNAAPNAYIWYTTTGTAQPTGLFSATAMRSYDTTTWQNITNYSHIGYSN